MKALFERKSPMDKLEAELASLRARAETLNSRHAAADAEFLDAKSKLQRHHLEADLNTGDKARTKLEAAVAACALIRDGYADALAEVHNKIADSGTETCGGTRCCRAQGGERAPPPAVVRKS